MTNVGRHNSRVKSLSKRLRAEAKNIRIDNFILFIYTAEITFNYLDKELRPSGLNRTQMGILTMLVLHGGLMTASELSKCVVRSQNATTKALDSLEKLGLVNSGKANFNSKVKVDRRLRRVSITEKGLELLENTVPARHQIGSSLMCCLNRNEANTFKAILSRLVKHIASLEPSEPRYHGDYRLIDSSQGG